MSDAKRILSIATVATGLVIAAFLAMFAVTKVDAESPQYIEGTFELDMTPVIEYYEEQEDTELILHSL